MNAQPRPNLIYLLLIILILGIICFIIYFAQGPIYQTLYNWDLIPKPERFTELYFNNSETLPSSTTKDDPLSFSFTIHNEEGTSTVYPYTVYFQDPEGDKTTITKNTVTLPDNASTTIAISHVFKSTDEQGSVVVDLTSLNQQIDFLLSNPNQ
jgi:hypothetical protein